METASLAGIGMPSKWPCDVQYGENYLPSTESWSSLEYCRKPVRAARCAAGCAGGLEGKNKHGADSDVSQQG